jgi:hypothetical protein
MGDLFDHLVGQQLERVRYGEAEGGGVRSLAATHRNERRVRFTPESRRDSYRPARQLRARSGHCASPHQPTLWVSFCREQVTAKRTPSLPIQHATDWLRCVA